MTRTGVSDQLGRNQRRSARVPVVSPKQELVSGVQCMNTVPVRSSVNIHVWLNGPVLGLSPPVQARPSWFQCSPRQEGTIVPSTRSNAPSCRSTDHPMSTAVPLRQPGPQSAVNRHR